MKRRKSRLFEGIYEEDRKQFLQSFRSRIQSIDDGDDLEEIFLEPEAMKFLPIGSKLTVANNHVRFVRSLKTPGKQKRLLGPMLEIDAQGLSGPQAAQVFEMEVADIKSAVQRSQLNQGRASLEEESRKPCKSRGPYYTSNEGKWTRKWFKDTLCEQGESGSKVLLCMYSRKKVERMYFEVGCVQIYARMADSDEYKERVDAFDPDNANPSKKSLIQSLYWARRWKREGFKTPRPQCIWSRSRKFFWRLIDARKPSQGKRGALRNI